MIEVKQAVIGSENVSWVSARDLYVGLGLRKTNWSTNWSRWSKDNIEENQFFVQGVDFVKLVTATSAEIPNPPKDYAITIQMATHLSMMAKTVKAHDYRNYFIECEKQLKQPLSHLEILVQSAMALVEHERKMKAL